MTERKEQVSQKGARWAAALAGGFVLSRLLYRSLGVRFDVTPLAWGERFHEKKFVNRAAMRLIAERGGH